MPLFPDYHRDGIVVSMLKGPNFGVDFEGDVVLMSYDSKRALKPTVQVIDALKGPLVKAPEVKNFGNAK
ncbi:MAG: hypothetical protein IPN88_04630 [Bacteroidetes bacterium]|nr:hypothetical protein [Bacteroidota bacterium]